MSPRQYRGINKTIPADSSGRVYVELPDNKKNYSEAEFLIITEKAFRKYARCHNAPAEMEELEWKRFLKILKNML